MKGPPIEGYEHWRSRLFKFGGYGLALATLVLAGFWRYRMHPGLGLPIIWRLRTLTFASFLVWSLRCWRLRFLALSNPHSVSTMKGGTKKVERRCYLWGKESGPWEQHRETVVIIVLTIQDTLWLLVARRSRIFSRIFSCQLGMPP